MIFFTVSRFVLGNFPPPEQASTQLPPWREERGENVSSPQAATDCLAAFAADLLHLTARAEKQL